MPRDPKDVSLTGQQRQARRLGEAEDQKDPIRLRIGSGPAGAEGKAGSTWYSGTTVPSTGLGAIGDFYFRTTTSDVYKKTGESIWTFEVNIKGATGEKGETGKEGPAGTTTMNGWKEPVRCATTANITISTALVPGAVIDGVTLVEGNRVLVKDQTTTTQNGIYKVAPTPVRTTDADEAGELRGGTIVYVESGTVSADRLYKIITDGSITPGTTAHTWLQLPSGRRIAGAVSAAGAVLNGTGFTVTNPATGEYKITLTTELVSTGVLLLTLNGSFTQVFKTSGPSKKEWTINIKGFNGLGGGTITLEAANEPFSFEIVQV